MENGDVGKLGQYHKTTTRFQNCLHFAVAARARSVFSLFMPVPQMPYTSHTPFLNHLCELLKQTVW